uniref:Uncharacterized protein n=1 Tax=Neolamprologus brichardi TaxID=32507 RepID=A0A3Q4G6N0_NEOBR
KALNIFPDHFLKNHTSKYPRALLPRIVQKYNLFGLANTLPRSGQRAKLSPSDDRKLVEHQVKHSVPIHSEVSIASGWTWRAPTGPNAFWRNVLWSDEKMPELFSQNDRRYVWRSKGECFKRKNTVKHGAAHASYIALPAANRGESKGGHWGVLDHIYFKVFIILFHIESEII